MRECWWSTTISSLAAASLQEMSREPAHRAGREASGSTPDPSLAELVDALQTTMGLVRAHFAAATANLGVTPAQAKALRQLSEPHTLKELAAQLGADVANTSGTVDRLEARGLVRREIHDADRRVRRLTLTDEGQRVRHALQEAAFGKVPPLERLDPNQRRELYALLKRTATP
jgi:DNA-binding MarR family transcriptional regulator